MFYSVRLNKPQIYTFLQSDSTIGKPVVAGPGTAELPDQARRGGTIKKPIYLFNKINTQFVCTSLN